jgi:hypothetical protein
MARLISFFFTLQTNLKLYHWQTLCHARHVAADKAVEKIQEHADHFMEVFIGKYGRPKHDPKFAKISLEPLTDDTVIPYLKEVDLFISKEICGKILKSPQDSDLINICDEIRAVINQTLYLFTLK